LRDREAPDDARCPSPDVDPRAGHESDAAGRYHARRNLASWNDGGPCWSRRRALCAAGDHEHPSESHHPCIAAKRGCVYCPVRFLV
jgi:hypothetical protein